jgi:hypothetical protein
MSDNTGRKTTLDQFADGDEVATFSNPPRVILNRPYSETYRVPHDRSKIAGWTGIDKERGRCYLSVRSKNQHYFEKYEGYAVSEPVLERANRDNVDWVLVWESDRERTYVWRLTDFLAAEEVNSRWTPAGDTQKVMPTERAVGIWDQHQKPVEDRR